MVFQYRVKDSKGVASKGTIDAHSESEVVKILRDRNFVVIEVLEQGEIAHQTALLSGFLRRVGFGEIVDFTRQLSTMIIAGLSLVDSLSLLESQTKSRTFKSILGDIIENIRGGSTFSVALKNHPREFNKIYCALISAGEKSGKLDVVLERLAENLEKSRSFRNKVRTAMIYPIIIIVGIVALTSIMMIFVIPKMTEIYSGFEIELPLPTKILIGFSTFMVNFWWLVFLIIGGFIAWVPSFAKTEGGSHFLDSFVLHLPIIGSLKKDMVMTELTSTLGLLIGAGVPILESIEKVADALGSTSYTDSMYAIAKKVEKGFPLGLMFSQDPLYPPIIGQMLIVGEETGKVDETMNRISKYFEQQSDEKIKRLSTAIEPVILVILGLGVAFVVLSIVLPMYQLTEAF